MYQFKSNNEVIGYAIEPTYIKKMDNDCYGLCSAAEATGVVVGGTPYALSGKALDNLPVAEVTTISDSEFFNFVMQSNAALTLLGVKTEEVATDEE